MKIFIDKLIGSEDLSKDEAYQALSLIMEGRVNKSHIASFLTALKIKGESSEEISGFAKAMLDKAEKVPIEGKDLVDTCGTGGDGLDTFNISTTAAFIAAGAGVKVAKHGNRSVSSRCGSADVLEACGVNIAMDIEGVARCIEKIGIGFIFAPVAHIAMRHVAEVRKELGMRTVFNILGPITNPANAAGRLLGVYEQRLLDLLPRVLEDLGINKAFIINSINGMDELSTSSESHMVYIGNGRIEKSVFRPQDYGFSLASIDELKGGDKEKNAKILTGILTGRSKGAARDTAVINAAAAIVAGAKASSLAEGIRSAEQAIENGKAFEKLEKLIEFSKTS